MHLHVTQKRIEYKVMMHSHITQKSGIQSYDAFTNNAKKLYTKI